MICLILFSEFSNVFPAFTCANATDSSCSIYLEGNILNPLPFCWLLNSRIFLAISITFQDFNFQEVSFY